LNPLPITDIMSYVVVYVVALFCSGPVVFLFMNFRM